MAAAQPAQPAEPDPRALAWHASLRASRCCLDRIERDVQEQTGLPLAFFEVLVALHDQPEGRRMGELAGALLLSRGGATRLIARMEEAGLVTRHVPADDRRATYAVITARGAHAVEQAAPVHAEAVHRWFGAALDEHEAERLHRTSQKLLRRIGAG